MTKSISKIASVRKLINSSTNCSVPSDTFQAEQENQCHIIISDGILTVSAPKMVVIWNFSSELICQITIKGSYV